VGNKWVYLSSMAKKDLTRTLGHKPEPDELKTVLGLKGAGLAELLGTGLPVPPAFTINTEACIEYVNSGEFPNGMWEQVLEALAEVEKAAGKKLGDPKNPLLVSVRSGARVSMPGMMDTVLNLGLNDETRASLAELSGDEWFSYDAYRRFITMFSDIVMNYSREHFKKKLQELKDKEGVKLDPEVSLEGIKSLVAEYKRMYKNHFGTDFPSSPEEQVRLSVKAAFDSWSSPGAIACREHEGLPHDWGTAVNVQTMVFGNLGENSGTGVAFTRDPATGEKVLYGEYLDNAQGADVVAGLRTPMKIAELQQVMPDIYEQFLGVAGQLEAHYRDMQDMEFTIEQRKLWLLRARPGRRTAAAAGKIAKDLWREGLITRREAVSRAKALRLVGTMTFRLLGDPAAKEASIEFSCTVNEPRLHPIIDPAFVMTRGWPLFLEAQIGKLPRELQDVTLGAIADYIRVWKEYDMLPPAKRPKPGHSMLAEVRVEMHLGSRLGLYVLVHPSFSGIGAVNAIGLVLVGSLGHVALALRRQEWEMLAALLIYGINKWEKHGRPGWLTAFTKTWDFSDIEGMIQGMQRT